MATIVLHHNIHCAFSVSPAGRARLVLGAALCALALAGCSPREKEEEGSAGVLAVPVEVEQVERHDLRRVAQSTASLSSREERVLLSEIAGRVTRVHFAEGDEIAERAEVARIENEDIRLSGEDAEASVRRLEREIAELEPLVAQGFLPRQQLDDLRFRLEQATTAQRRVRSQQTGQRLRSPIAGVLVARMVDPGDIVVPNQQLFRIVATDALEAVVNLPERELAHVRVGQEALVRVPAVGMQDYRGEVTRIHPVVDARTGTVRVHVRVTDPDAFEGERRLRPGNFSEVRIVTEERRQVPSVPRRAIVHEGTSPFLLTLGERDDETAAPEAFGGDAVVHRVVRVPVVLGHADDRRVELLDGPAVGAWIITVGQGGLETGSRVVPMREGNIVDAEGASAGSSEAEAAVQDSGESVRAADFEAPGEEP